jgi:hypothetical protein
VTDRRLEARDRMLAPVAVHDAAGEVVGANLGALIRRLILFEEVVLDSYGMRELPALVDALGSDGFVALLESDALRIRADGWAYGEIGGGGLTTRESLDPLPPFEYAFGAIVPVEEDRKSHIQRCLGEIRGMPLPMTESQRVRRAIVDALVPFPEGRPGVLSSEALTQDLTTHVGLVRVAVAQALAKQGRPLTVASR